MDFYNKKKRKKWTSSGTSKSPMTSSFLCKWTPSREGNRDINRDYLKIACKGVIGDLFCRSALHQ